MGGGTNMGRRICPACREWWYASDRRPKGDDALCPTCRGLINEALQMHADAEKAVDKLHVVVAVPKYDHWWPGFYSDLPHNVTHTGSFRDRLHSALIAVYRLTGVPMPGRAQGVLPWEGRDFGGWDGTCSAPKRKMTLKQYRALKRLRLCIEGALAETMHYATQDGKDLLLSLASGALSVEQLQEADIEKAKHLQERNKYISKQLRDLTSKR
jgi:hypothetical protein